MAENHYHDATGAMVLVDDKPTEAEAEAVEVAASADVEIARIQAEKEITLAKISAGMFKAEMESELEALRAELKGFKEGVEVLTPEPEPEPVEPEPVIIDTPPAEPVEEMPPPPAEEPETHHRSSKPKGLGIW